MPNSLYYLLLGTGPPSGGGGGSVPGVATSIIFADGVEHISAANEKWLASTGGNPPIAASEAGAHGRCYNNATLREAHDIGANLATLSAGCRFKLVTVAADNLLRFQDSSTNQLTIQIQASGAFSVARGNFPGTIL